MQSLEEFKKRYQLSVEPDYLRLMKKMRIIRVLMSAILLTGVLFLIFSDRLEASYLLLIIIVLAALSFHVVKLQSNNARDFIHEITPKMIGLINPDYQYTSHCQLTLKTFLDSELYLETPNSLVCHGTIKGKIHNTDFELYQLSTIDKSGRTPIVLFEGFLLKIPLKRIIHGEVYVFTDTNGSLRGESKRDFRQELGDWIRFPLDFKKYFSVFCINENEARKLIGPNMRKSLINLKEKVDLPLKIALRQESLLCTFPYNNKILGRLSEYHFFKRDLATEYFKLFSAVDYIVEHVQLDPEKIEADQHHNPGNGWRV